MVFGLWLDCSILGMKIITVDKYIWEYAHAISPSRITGVLKSYIPVLVPVVFGHKTSVISKQWEYVGLQVPNCFLDATEVTIFTLNL